MLWSILNCLILIILSIYVFFGLLYVLTMIYAIVTENRKVKKEERRFNEQRRKKKENERES